MKDIVILGGARTPIGSFQGTLSSLAAPRLGAIAIKCALENSGMQAVMYAANDIRCGEYDLAVAGGMESMSNAPYALPQARGGYRMGNGKMIDIMIHDGLWDPYGDKHMGSCAETCVSKYEFT